MLTIEKIQKEVGEAMIKGARTLEFPMPVDGHPDLITRAVIEVPSAIRKVGIGKWQHGKWSVEKQMIVWEDMKG